MREFNITPRPLYTERLLQLLSNENLVIAVGVRRSGKSSIAELLEDELRARYPEGAKIIRINFEMIGSGRITADDLIARFQAQYEEAQRNYILLDEVTHVIDWPQAINEIGQRANCKLFLFSSNRQVISQELQAVQEGKYDVVPVLPLSLEEFMQFQGFWEVTPGDTPLRDKRYRQLDERIYTLDEIYKFYITYGGLPILKPEYMDRERAWVVTDGSYGTVVTRDIMELGSDYGSSAVTDTQLLRAIITVMAKSVGDNISATWVGKQVADYLERSSSTKTIESYIRALLNAHLFYIAERYDIKAGRTLKTLAKYYIVDAGLHNYVTGIRAEDESRLLENKVFFEMLRRGYHLFNGKLGKEEISLIAQKGKQRVYIQVANEADSGCMEALLSPLRKIRESHPKLIIVFDGESGITEDGIMILNALEFLMGRSWGQ